MERLISVLGLVVLLGIAFLLSNNKKMIKPRIFFWGLSLQLLFAVIVLNRGFLSFIGLFILFFMIVLYMLDKDIESKFKKKWLGGAVILVVSLLTVAAFYFLDASHVMKPVEKEGGNYVEVCYPQYAVVAEYGPFDNLKEAFFSRSGNSYIIVYTSGGKDYVEIDKTLYGPYDSVRSAYFAKNGADWIVEYETANAAGVREVYYLQPSGVTGPIGPDSQPAFSHDGQAWGKSIVSEKWYTRLGEASYGPFVAAKPGTVGGFVIYVLLAVLVAAITLSILTKRGVVKQAVVSKLFWSVVLLLTFSVLWARGIYGAKIMAAFSVKVEKFLSLTDLGTDFLFHSLVNVEFMSKYGMAFAISVLPTIIFFSSFMAILYYFGVLQSVVAGMARFMRWTMGTSGAESLSCASNIFVGQTEAPLLIKPYLKEMTKSEIHAIMVGGFATIAGGVMAGYIKMGVSATHLIAASVMSAPAALMVSKLMYPETEHSKTAGDVELPKVETSDNVLGAAAAGVTDGLNLALNVGAMLIAFIALIGFVDQILAWGDKLIDGRLIGGSLIPGSNEYKGIFPGSLKTLLGTVFRPIAWVMGVPWKESAAVGNLLGLKISVNEFVAYGMLGQHIANNDLGPRSIIIATYALCGFANFSSIGIQIGGIGTLVPERRSEIAALGLRAMIGGAIASWITATIAGILL